MAKKKSFIMGGAASGKSTFAETLVRSSGKSMVYLATAQCFDAEMRTKIDRHKKQRGSGWCTIEAPFDLIAPLDGLQSDEIVLLDCITMWLSNHLLKASDLDQECDQLISALERCTGQLVVVSNEVGQGIVPDNALALQFRTLQGRLNQRIAATADTVVFVTAGLPTLLKGML